MQTAGLEQTSAACFATNVCGPSTVEPDAKRRKVDETSLAAGSDQAQGETKDNLQAANARIKNAEISNAENPTAGDRKTAEIVGSKNMENDSSSTAATELTDGHQTETPQGGGKRWTEDAQIGTETNVSEKNSENEAPIAREQKSQLETNLAGTEVNKDSVATENSSSSSSSSSKVCGVLIALCCHHQCSWRAYVGKAFMRQCDFTASDFSLLSRLTSWAVCGWRDRDGSFSK
jgi:hypothetical protein